jgi:hypothetical protein
MKLQGKIRTLPTYRQNSPVGKMRMKNILIALCICLPLAAQPPATTPVPKPVPSPAQAAVPQSPAGPTPAPEPRPAQTQRSGAQLSFEVASVKPAPPSTRDNYYYKVDDSRADMGSVSLVHRITTSRRD